MTKLPTYPDWWAELLEERQRVVTASEIYRGGLEKPVRTRLARGDMCELCPGVYYDGRDPQDHHRLIAAVLHAGRDACLSGERALVLLGLERWTAREGHIVAPHPVRALEPWQFHRGLRKSRTIQGLAVALAPEAIVDAAAWAATDATADAVVRTALQQGLATADQVAVVLLPNGRRSGLVRRILDDVRGGATTKAEAALARAWAEAGLPPLRTQETFVDAGGQTRRVDAFFDRACFPKMRVSLGIELLGLGHLDPTTAKDDGSRGMDILAQGVFLQGVLNDEVLRNPQLFVRRWVQVLKHWGWDGTHPVADQQRAA